MNVEEMLKPGAVIDVSVKTTAALVAEIRRARMIEDAAISLYYASKQSDMDICTEAADALFTAIEINPRRGNDT